MQFLKTLFWVILAVGLVLFARENWVPVTINLWSGLQADVKLPALVAAAFLLGFVPMYLIHRGQVWALRRRFGQSERVTVGNQPVTESQPVLASRVDPNMETAPSAPALTEDRPTSAAL